MMFDTEKTVGRSFVGGFFDGKNFCRHAIFVDAKNFF